MRLKMVGLWLVYDKMNMTLFFIDTERTVRDMPDQNFHEQNRLRDPLKTSSNRSFGLVFTVVFVLLGLAPLFFGDTIRLWALALAAVFLVLSLAHPQILAPLNLFWTKFGLLLHRIISPVIMALLFFGVVTPIGLLMRLFGKRPLSLEFEPKIISYWIEREPPGPDPQTMKQQF